MNNDKTQITATPHHCIYCFDVLISAAKHHPTPLKDYPPLPSSIPDTETPVFVSWHKNGHELRGCIGTFAKDSLSESLPEYTMKSAFEDKRFKPISEKEISSLSCSVSLLTNFEKAKDALDWEIGKHGIIIELEEDDEYYRATYLPDVPKPRGWTKEETLKHLLKKAGYGGKLKDVMDKLSLERYESSKCEITYQEYSDLKIQHDGKKIHK